MRPDVHHLPVPIREDIDPLLISRCWLGKEPAELLEPRERELLLFELWEQRWTDLQIATHMKQSLYTTCRIRERLGLPARRPRREAA